MPKTNSLILLLFILFTCDSGKVFEKHSKVKAALRWEKTDKKSFQVDIRDIGVNYAISIAIRHHAAIPYGSLRVNMRLIGPSGKMIDNDYIVPLRNKNTGALLGDVSGDICDTETRIIQKQTFSQAGKYTFELTQVSAAKGIGGVMEVGLIIGKIINKP